MYKWIKAFAPTFLVIVFFCSFSFAEGEPEIVSLDQAIQQALAANPDLASLKSKTLALADIPDQKGTLPDPQIVFRAANLPTDTFSLTQEPMTQLQVGLNQALPFPGKLSLLEHVAELESEEAVADFQEKQLMLVQNVKQIWWNIFFLDKSIIIVGRNQDLFRQLEQIAQTKYTVGGGLQQDVLLAQLELSKFLNLIISLKNNLKNQVASFNVLLNRPVSALMSLPLVDDEDLPEAPNLKDMQAHALASRPLLNSFTKKNDSARTRIELAEKEFYPNFMVGAVYGYRDGQNPDKSDRADFASLSVSMNIPLFNKASKGKLVSQRKHQFRQQTYAFESEQNKVLVQVETAINDYQQSLDEIYLIKQGIIPQAQQTLDSMLAGYQVNKVDFFNLIRAQTALYNYETRYWKAFSSAKQALARLAAAIGEETIHE